MIWQRVWLKLVLLVVVANATLTRAVAESPDTPSMRSFRRVFAPLDQIIELAGDNSLPMDRDLFERIVASLKSAPPPEVRRQAQIERAEYSATLNQMRLENGTARLKIHAESKNQIELDLHHQSLPIRSATWEESGLPAVLGKSNQGEQVLLVSTAGTCRFEWSLAGQLKADAIEFRIALSPALVSVFRLTTGSNVQLSTNRGVITSQMVGSKREWTIQTSGAGELVISVVDDRNAVFSKSKYAEYTNVYSVSDQGMDISATVKLTEVPKRQTELLVQLSERVQPTSIRVNDAAAAWQLRELRDDGTAVIAVTLPERPMSSDGASAVTLQVSAIADVQFTEPTRLPRLSVLQSDWLQERALVNVSHPVSALSVILKQCQQTDFDVLGSSRTFRFEYEKPIGDILIQFGRNRHRLLLNTATAIQIDDSIARAVTIADAEVQRGDVFSLDALVTPEWTIESVVAVNAQGVVGQTIDDWEEINEDGRKKLTIRLRKPILASRPIRLRIEASRRFSNGVEYSVNGLRPLTFDEHGDDRSILAVRTAESRRIAWTDAPKVRWLRADQVDTERLLALGVQESDIVCEVSRATRATFRLSESGAAFNVDMHLRAYVTRGVVDETLTMEVQPISGGVTAVTIRMAESDSENAYQWSLADSNEPIVVEAATASDGIASAVLRLPTSFDIPFVIVGKRQLPFNEAFAVRAVQPVDANAISASMTISASLNTPIECQASDIVTQLPHQLADENEVLGPQYRYQVEVSQVDSLQTTLLNVSLSDKKRNRRATVWRSETTTIVDPLGSHRHWVHLYLENHGEDALPVTLPAGLILDSIYVDGASVNPASVLPGVLHIPLSSQERFTNVSIALRETGTVITAIAKRLGQQIHVPQLEIDSPVIDTKWKIWLPPGATPVRFGVRQDPLTLYDAMQRFFGPFARNPQERPFDLFSDQSWMELFDQEDPDAALRSANLLLQKIDEFTDRNDATWGDVVNAYAGANRIARSSSLIVPLVDAQRLIDVGIHASSRLLNKSEKTSLRQSLPNHPICIVAARNYVFLTTTSGVGQLGNLVEPTDDPHVVRVRYGLRSTRDVDLEVRHRLGTVTTVTEWLDKGNTPSRWKTGSPDDVSLVLSGWTLQERSDRLNETSIKYMDRYFVQRLSYVVFFVAAGATWWLAMRRTRYALAVPLFAATVCIVVPPELIRLGTFCFWGAVTGAVIDVVRQITLRRDVKETGKRSLGSTIRVTRVGATSMIVIAILFVAIVGAWAEEIEPSKVVDVFVPIHDDGKLDEEHPYVYLPRDFYDQLIEYDVKTSGRAAKWIVLSTSYSMTLEEKRDDDTVSLRAKFTIATLDSDVFIQLPMPAESLKYLQRTALLNRRDILLHRQSGETFPGFHIDDPDTYELTLTFEIPIRLEGVKNVVSLPVISVADSELTVQTTAHVRDLQVTALGEVVRDTQVGRLRASLGPIETLTVQWPADSSMNLANRTTAKQISWLNISSQGVTCRFKVHVESPSGQFDPLRILAESDLVPTRSGDQPTDVDQLPNGIVRYEFEPTVTSETRAVCMVEFDLPNANRVGRIHMPRLQVENVPTSLRLLAVSLADSFSGTPWRTTGVVSVPLSEFNDHWQGPERRPDYAYVINDPKFRYVFESSFADSSMNISAETIYIVGNGESSVLHTSQFVTQHRLFETQIVIPSDLIIDEISTLVGTERRSVDWARTSPDRATVLLPGDEPGSVILQLRGRMRHPDRPLTPVAIYPEADTDIRSTRVLLYRQFDVRSLEIETNGFSRVDVTGEPSGSIRQRLTEAEGVRLDSVWEMENSNAKMTVSIGAVEVQDRFDIVLVLQANEDAWNYQLQIRYLSDGDAPDEIRFVLPEGWSEPTPEGIEADIEVMASPYPGKQIVTVRPVSRLRNAQSWTLSGAIQSDGVEDVEVLDAGVAITNGQVERMFVGLLDNVTGAVWKPTSMVMLPREQLPNFANSIEDVELFRVTGEAPIFRRSRSANEDEVTSISVMRHSIYSERNVYRIVSDMLITAQSPGDLVWISPRDTRIEQILVNGVPLPFDSQANEQLLNIAHTNERQAIRIIWFASWRDFRHVESPVEIEFPRVKLRPSNAAATDRILNADETIWRFHVATDKIVEFYADGMRLASHSTAQRKNNGATIGDIEDFITAPAVEFRTAGPVDSTRVRFVEPKPIATYLRLGIALVGVLGSVVVIRAKRMPFNSIEAELWGYTGAVLFGIGWWLFLQPSLLGWVIVFGTLFLSWLLRV